MSSRLPLNQRSCAQSHHQAINNNNNNNVTTLGPYATAPVSTVMADEIEDDGPSGSSSYFSKAATTLSASHPDGQHTARPQNQPGLDRQSGAAAPPKTGVVQPKPQALSKRTGPAAIIVSTRQKGNPVLEKIKSMPWEWGEIPADYLLGTTTCALFLSLKYHRLHPEYIYSRIKALQGKYLLRIVLCMVDIENHEASLKELSKTSLINNVTIVLCWSAAEGARYLELFKTYENAAPTSIKQHQSTAYGDRMIDFVTTPRSINKTDAVSLVSQFGTVRTAVNAQHEEVSMIAGWGEKKVQQWCNSVREPFRIKRAAKRSINLDALAATQPISREPTLSRDTTRQEGASPAPEITIARVQSISSKPVSAVTDADRRPSSRLAKTNRTVNAYVDDEETMAAAVAASLEPANQDKAGPSSNAMSEAPKKRKPEDDPLNDGVMAALSKLRKT